MSLVIINDPQHLPWQTNVYDLLILTLFTLAAVNAVTQFRRGKRIYAFVFLAALLYGVTLELVGMATLNMYLQGNFLVMLNFPAIPLFAGSTAMPLYVTLFYPVIYSIGYKVVEGLAVPSRLQAATAGGFFMILLDAPYIIEGGLRSVIWWTWRSDFSMFQYWLGWPLIEMLWEATWGAVFFYVMLGARPHLDGPGGQRWTHARAFAAQVPLRALGVLTLGNVLLAPLIIWTYTVGPQWPMAIAYVATLGAIAIAALRSAEPPTRHLDRMLSVWTGLFAAAFAAMIVANVIREGGVTLYIAVQALGLLGVVAFATYPAWRPFSAHGRNLDSGRRSDRLEAGAMRADDVTA